jgi:hypothetical protein
MLKSKKRLQQTIKRYWLPKLLANKKFHTKTNDLISVLLEATADTMN